MKPLILLALTIISIIAQGQTSPALPVFLEGSWTGYPADSSFCSRINYQLSPHGRFLYAENQLCSKEGDVFAVYEGMYFIENDTLRFYLKGPKGEFHKGTASSTDDTLTHIAWLYPATTIKSYRSKIIKPDEDHFEYYANYSKSLTPPDTVELKNPILYTRNN